MLFEEEGKTDARTYGSEDAELARELPSLFHHEARLVGISGWLVFPAIGIVLTIGLTLYQIGATLVSLFGKPAQDTTDVIAAVVSMGIDGVILAWFVVVAFLFFRRHRWARWAMVVTYGGSAVLALVGLALSSSFAVAPGVASRSAALGLAETMRYVLWAGYFVRSKRVTNTFVN